MGLSAMANVPNMEEQMRMSNHSGYGSYIDPNAWTGEQSLGCLGLGDMEMAGLGDNGQVTNSINQIAQTVGDIYTRTQAAKAARKGKAAPMAKHDDSSMPATNGGGSGPLGLSTTTWLLIGGGALALIGLIILMSKKKKGGERKED